MSSIHQGRLELEIGFDNFVWNVVVAGAYDGARRGRAMGEVVNEKVQWTFLPLTGFAGKRSLGFLEIQDRFSRKARNSL